uniref:Arminin 10850 n=1 Tax=Hydra oligactis TaxID=6088 RepID=R9UCX7_HYDOL|nr:arminin 10850 [Hydra oligactis]
MRSVCVVLFFTLIALTYAKNFEDVKAEIKNEVETEILKDLEEEDDELDDDVQEETNDARPFRRFLRRIRGRKLLPYVPAGLNIWKTVGRK